MSEPNLNGLISIGRAAELTGISVATLRVWERRYGKPVPQRLRSGHRRYTGDQVTWLRLVAAALARGHRPAEIVPLSATEFGRLLADDAGPVTELPPDVLDAVRTFRGDELVRRLRAARNELGTRRVLSEQLAPMMGVIGQAWAAGELDIRHEHHVTQQIEALLHHLLGDIPIVADGPAIVLTTLPGERHSIGLLMAASVVALSGGRPLLLGVDTPLDEIAASAREFSARAVGLSVSLATGGPATDRVIAELRDLLPGDVVLLVGGAGARGVRRGPRGVVHVSDLDDLERHVRALHPRRESA